VAGGRSKCPKCGKTIPWYDLIPLVSFFWLKLRCRQCKTRISWVYPLIELSSGVIFIISYVLFADVGVAYVLLQIFILELFLILAVIDLKHLILPDSILIFLIAGGLATFAIEPGINFLVGAASLFALLLLVWWLSGGRGLGFGDVKLAGVIGLIFGFWGGLVVLYLAVILGALIGIFLLMTGRANLKTKLPFGTIISLSAMFYILGGNLILGRLGGLFYTIPAVLK